MIDTSLQRLEKFIGRDAELSQIDAALAQGTSAILYLVGEGGMGKTRLLEEIVLRAQRRSQLVVAQLIDFIQPEHQQPIALMDALARTLQMALGQDDLFHTFRTIVEELLTESSTTAESGRVRAQDAFVADYEHAMQEHSVVLLFDTFEKLHPSIKGAEGFNFRANRQMEEWLVRFFQVLLERTNTLIFLAGRPRDRQEALVTGQLMTWLQTIPVQALTPPEITAYIQAVLAQEKSAILLEANELDDLSILLHEVSDGRPVILAIALALWHTGGIDLQALPMGFRAKFPANKGPLSTQFLQWINTNLAEKNPLFHRLVQIALYLRRGIRRDLLEHIVQVEHWDSAFLEAFDQLKGLVFVKTRTDSLGIVTLTLHDELYELLFELDPGLVQEANLYQHAIDDIKTRLAQLPPLIVGSDLLQHRQRVQTHTTEHLFYRLALNPVDGYQYYREIVYNAIISDDIYFDDQLQDELARFFDTDTHFGQEYLKRLQLGGILWDHVVFQEGIHWVYRQVQDHSPGGQVQRHAIRRLVQMVIDTRPELYQSNQLLHMSLAIAEYYGSNQFEDHYQETIVKTYRQLLADLETMRRHPATTALDLAQWRQATLQRAIALNDLGYYERRFNYLDAAIEHYRDSLRAYRELMTITKEQNTERSRAITLNNYGFALTLQGRADQGLGQVDEAISILRAAGALQRVAVGLNTRAQILLQQGKRDEALGTVLNARQTLETGSDQRFFGYCLRTEGDIRRRIAAEHLAQRDRSEEAFSQAIVCYQAALPLLTEHQRRVQALQELGATYRNRAYCRQEWGDASDRDLAEALAYLQQALVLQHQGSAGAQIDPILAAIYQDIAVAHFLSQDLAMMDQALQQARAAIPPEYQIIEDIGLNQTVQTRQQLIYWLRLGQVEFQHARGCFQKQQYKEACQALLRAFACQLAYSQQHPTIETTRRLGKGDVQAIGSVATLQELHDHTYFQAVILRLTGPAYDEMDRLFEEAKLALELG